MFGYKNFNKDGVMTISDVGDINSSMLMDCDVINLKKGDTYVVIEPYKESAILLISGSIVAINKDVQKPAKRDNFIKDPLFCVHFSKNNILTIEILEDSEILVQKTQNDNDFGVKWYDGSNVDSFTSCKGRWEGVAEREVVTVFDYKSAPYSNMVLGEIIVPQGRWFSYIPHSHPQPEIYYYRFLREEGFGACFIGEVAHTIKDGSFGCFDGGYTHPQVTAPGYPMYCVWLIRHLPDCPWTDRIDDPRFAHLIKE